MKSQPTMFGRIVRKLRIDRGVVLKEMADGIGVSTAYVSAVELGKKTISESFLNKVIQYFGLNAEQTEEIKRTAVQSQPSMKIDLRGTHDDDRDLIVSFARNYQDLSQERKDELRRLLGDDIGN